MSKGVYRRYRGSRRRIGVLVPTLVILCLLAAAFLVYVNFNLEDGGDGTTVLKLPFTENTIVFGEPEVELVVDEPVDVVVEVKVSEYEKRVEKPAFLTFDEEFDTNLAALTDVNTVVLKYKYDSGETITDEVAKEAHGKIKDAKLNACAMISCFKDKAYAIANPDFACKKENDELWQGADGFTWLNPYKDEACDYVLSVIEKAYAAGFREILLTNATFPMATDINYGEGLEKGAAISAFLDKITALCEAKGDLNVAIYFDGKDSTVTGEEIDTITNKFHRIYTRDLSIYNKVGTLIPEDKLARRIVNLAVEESAE